MRIGKSPYKSVWSIWFLISRKWRSLYSLDGWLSKINMNKIVFNDKNKITNDSELINNDFKNESKCSKYFNWFSLFGFCGFGSILSCMIGMIIYRNKVNPSFRCLDIHTLNLKPLVSVIPYVTDIWVTLRDSGW